MRNLVPKAKMKYQHREGWKEQGAFLLDGYSVIGKPDPSRP